MGQRRPSPMPFPQRRSGRALFRANRRGRLRNRGQQLRESSASRRARSVDRQLPRRRRRSRRLPLAAKQCECVRSDVAIRCACVEPRRAGGVSPPVLCQSKRSTCWLFSAGTFHQRVRFVPADRHGDLFFRGDSDKRAGRTHAQRPGPRRSHDQEVHRVPERDSHRRSALRPLCSAPDG